MAAERQRFEARTGALAEVTAFVERRCAELGAGRNATLRLMLVAEELFINAVVHGYGGDCGKDIVLTLRDTGRDLELVAEDGAPAFDPFARVPKPSTTGTVGGLGRALVAGVSSRHSYERRGRRNRVTVGVAKQRGTAPRKKSAKKS